MKQFGMVLFREPFASQNDPDVLAFVFFKTRRYKSRERAHYAPLGEKMAAVVSNYILKALCNNQCCLEFQQMHDILRQSFTVDHGLLKLTLLDSSRFRVVDEDSAARALSPGALIIATTSLGLCKDPTKCRSCEELHLCRYLVCGNCRFG